MEIKVDYEGRDDEHTHAGFHETTIRYWTNLSDEGYYYELYVIAEGQVARIVITDRGVSIDFKDSHETISTDLDPEAIFGPQTELEWDKHLSYIVHLLQKDKFVGKRQSKEDMNELYERFLKETSFKNN